MLRIRGIVGGEGGQFPKGIWPLGFPEKAAQNCRWAAFVSEWTIGGSVNTQIQFANSGGEAVPIAVTASSQKAPRAQWELLGAKF